MWYAVAVAAVVLGGVIMYLCYFAFVRRVYRDHGLDGVKQLAEALPPPRSIESVASAVRELAKSRSVSAKDIGGNVGDEPGEDTGSVRAR
jgi:hypothetical protein